MLERSLEYLARLVSFDTCNPPRNIHQEGIFKYLVDSLPGFTHTVWDYGEGRISLLAIRGKPQQLFNFHIDTVPSTDQWSGDPWTLQDAGENVIGLGACDIKGATAAMLSAVEQTTQSIALLFTSDEEAGNSHCIKTFINDHNDFERVIVAEPTQCEIVTSHRGIITAKAEFTGTSGHSSAQKGVGASATHQAIAWGHTVLEWAVQQEQIKFENLQGTRLNIGVISGGIKANMIAAEASINLGLRSLPNQNQSELIGSLSSTIKQFEGASLEPAFIAPGLNNSDSPLALALPGQRGKAVDFWTEAALFAATGIDAVVWGPGDIAQAHTADEWVSKRQLLTMAENYQKVIRDGTA